MLNLIGSAIFLIALGLLYGTLGTLNLADLAYRLTLPGHDQALARLAFALLIAVFLLKAGLLPLSFWLPHTYSAAGAPVAALFAIMTKVGIYAILRLSSLAFGEGAGASAGFGQSFLLYAGMASLAFGAIGVLASRSSGRMAGYCVLVSSGTLLAAIGFSSEQVTGGALFYLVSSTFAVSAFFLLLELLERVRIEGADVQTVTVEDFSDDDDEAEEVEEVSVAIPGALAVLSVCFGLCVVLLAGLPPLTGFVAKFAMLSSMLNPTGLGGAGVVAESTWWLIGLVIFSGFAALIALTRTGINTLWVQMSDHPAPVRVLEIAPVILLVALCMVMAVMAGPVMNYTMAAAAELYHPGGYVSAVLPTPLDVPFEEVSR